MSSNYVLSKYYDRLITFTHNSRQYYEASSEEIVSIAMSSLNDVRLPSCVEGLLLLITCLPTVCAPSLYDSQLHKWVDIWTRFDYPYIFLHLSIPSFLPIP